MNELNGCEGTLTFNQDNCITQEKINIKGLASLIYKWFDMVGSKSFDIIHKGSSEVSLVAGTQYSFEDFYDLSDKKEIVFNQKMLKEIELAVEKKLK